MSKFRIKMKLQGLELEIEGSREDTATIGRNIGQQLSGMLGPSVGIINGESMPSSQASPPVVMLTSDEALKRSRRRAKAAVNGSSKDTPQPVQFKNDPAKYGTPSQQWKTAQKAIWLLYVVKESSGIEELTTGQIVKTFNTHFRQAKTVTSSNVSRDLGKVKTTGPALVGEDTTKTPPAWYLTDAGRKFAQALIAESLAPSTASAAAT